MLNAFRHQRINHSEKLTSLPLVLPCAQRLSASKDKSLHPVLSLRFLSPLSAQRLSASKDKSPELSKLRLFPSGCAQRLSASKDKSLHIDIDRIATFARAQRLSASKDKSRQVLCVSRCGVRVLNAFRHQRINHGMFVSIAC